MSHNFCMSQGLGMTERLHAKQRAEMIPGIHRKAKLVEISQWPHPFKLSSSTMATT